LATNDFVEGIGGNGVYRYILTSSGTVPTMGGEVKKTVQAGVTFDYFFGENVRMCETDEGPDCTRDLGHSYFNNQKSIIHLDTTNIAEGRYLRPGRYNLSYFGRYGEGQGPGAEEDHARQSAEDLVLLFDEYRLEFPEWRDANGDHLGRDPGGGVQYEEFLVDYNLQDHNEQFFQYIDENGTNNEDSPPFNFEVLSRDPENEDDVFIAELNCRFNSSQSAGCEDDLDLEPGAPCTQFCDATEAAFGSGSWPDYQEACMNACYRNSSEVSFSFQDVHPDSEAHVRCSTPDVCLRHCSHNYQWNYYDSTCRQQCDTTHGFLPSRKQPQVWMQCMVDCTNIEESFVASECNQLCDNPDLCFDYFAGDYQRYARTDDPQQGFPGAPIQLNSECFQLCSGVTNIWGCRERCDKKFFRRDTTGDIVISAMNRVVKDKYGKFYWHDEDDDNSCHYPPCEPATGGSVHFGDGTSLEIGFVLNIEQDQRIVIVDFQWLEVGGDY